MLMMGAAPWPNRESAPQMKGERPPDRRTKALLMLMMGAAPWPSRESAS